METRPAADADRQAIEDIARGSLQASDAVDPQETDATELSIGVPPTVAADGEELRVDRDEPIPGSDAPFFPVFGTDGEGSRWGFFCNECGSTSVAADGLDRLECSDCDDLHRADAWDEAYL